MILTPRRPRVHPLSGQPINCGQVPFGFKDINGILEEDPLEKFVLERIKELRNKGSSLNEIAHFLTQSGIPTKNGGTWQGNTVNQMLIRFVNKLPIWLIFG